MAKTQNSLTGDPNIKNAPTGFKLVINDMFVSAGESLYFITRFNKIFMKKYFLGAGFIVPIVGEISRMPGLPTRPSIYDIDLNTETGEIEGLF